MKCTETIADDRKELFYDKHMIEELNLLANRIEQLVEKLRSLSGEAQSLRQQVRQLETEREALVEIGRAHV